MGQANFVDQNTKADIPLQFEISGEEKLQFLRDFSGGAWVVAGRDGFYIWNFGKLFIVLI
jgi:hypothetical protein